MPGANDLFGFSLKKYELPTTRTVLRSLGETALLERYEKIDNAARLRKIHVIRQILDRGYTPNDALIMAELTPDNLTRLDLHGGVMNQVRKLELVDDLEATTGGLILTRHESEETLMAWNTFSKTPAHGPINRLVRAHAALLADDGDYQLKFRDMDTPLVQVEDW
jgi:hypothetical protein